MIDHTLNKAVSGNEEFLISRIKQLDPTKRWQVSVKPYKSKRTLAQNDWARGYARKASKHFGYTPDEMYDILMFKHNPIFVTDKDSGEVIRMPGSFSKLDTKEAAEVQEAIIQFGAEHGFYLDGAA
jgi:hypothetical protein